MIKRQWIISIIVSLLILLIGSLLASKMEAHKKSTVSNDPIKEQLTYVTTQQFEQNDIQSQISIDGRINAFEKIDMAAEVSGRLLPLKTTWNKGTAFKKGQLLFMIDDADDKFSLLAMRSSLLSTITQIMPDLKFDYPEAFERWNTYLRAFDVEASTPALPSMASEQEKYFISGKNILNLYYNIKSAEEKLKHYRVVAPFDGVFLSVNAYPGSLVTPGAPLARIMNNHSFELETPIDLKNSAFVKQGQRVELVSEELNKTYTGRINRISNQIDQLTQSIPIYIGLSGSGLKDGMYLKGNLQGSNLQDVCSIPVDAIVDQNQVYVLQDSIIQRKQIQVLLRADDSVIVDGLDSTDKVIIKGINSLSAGLKAVALNQ